MSKFRFASHDGHSRARTKRPRVILWSVLLIAVIVAAAALVNLWRAEPDAVKDIVTIEAGGAVPSVKDFLKEDAGSTLFFDINDAELVTDLTAIPRNVTGDYPVEIRIGRFHYYSKLRIEDTVPPTGEVRDVMIMSWDSLDVDAFIVSATDVTGVTAEYVMAPDLSVAGDQEVVIRLTDGGGNYTDLEATLTIVKDVTAPVIDGVQDQEIVEGDTISYRNGVTVTDDYDPAPTLEIDNSGVDLTKAGEYIVTYRATDFSGNTSDVTAIITVKPLVIGIENIDEMRRLAADAVDECIYEGQTELTKLYSMYWWIKNNMKYSGTSDKNSWINEAIRGFKERNGDCFTYFAMLKAMMESEGYETIDVQRIEGYETRHFWSLVKFHDNWYHIDSCPRSVEHMKYWYCFLRTDDELAWLDEQLGEPYYDFDRSLYPATPTVKLNTGLDIDGDY